MTKIKTPDPLPSIELSTDERLALLEEDVLAVTQPKLMLKLHADIVELRGKKGNFNRKLERIAEMLTRKMMDSSKTTKGL